MPPDLAQAAVAADPNLLALLIKAPTSPVMRFVMPMAVCATARLLIVPEARVFVVDLPSTEVEIWLSMPKTFNAVSGCNPAAV